MSARALALLLLAAGALPGAVTTDHTDLFASLPPAHWTANGPVAVAGVSVASSTPGSLISTLAVPGGSTGYEVATRLRFASPDQPRPAARSPRSCAPRPTPGSARAPRARSWPSRSRPR